MSLGLPQRITVFLIAATVLAPYFIMEQSLLGGSSLRIVAPIWSFVSFSGGAFFFEIPIGLTLDYLPFLGMCLIIAGLTYFSIARSELTRLGYAILSFILLVIQLVYFIFIGYLASSGPPITITPLPIVALLALFLAPFIIRPPSSPGI